VCLGGGGALAVRSAPPPTFLLLFLLFGGLHLGLLMEYAFFLGGGGSRGTCQKAEPLRGVSFDFLHVGRQILEGRGELSCGRLVGAGCSGFGWLSARRFVACWVGNLLG
jgi:hypothetical protein